MGNWDQLELFVLPRSSEVKHGFNDAHAGQYFWEEPKTYGGKPALRQEARNTLPT